MKKNPEARNQESEVKQLGSGLVLGLCLLHTKAVLRAVRGELRRRRHSTLLLFCIIGASIANCGAQSNQYQVIQFRRGPDSARAGVVFAAGEPAFTTNSHRLYIGDGTTPGGLPLAMASDLSVLSLGATNTTPAFITVSNVAGGYSIIAVTPNNLAAIASWIAIQNVFDSYGSAAAVSNSLSLQLSASTNALWQRSAGTFAVATDVTASMVSVTNWASGSFAGSNWSLLQISLATNSLMGAINARSYVTPSVLDSATNGLMLDLKTGWLFWTNSVPGWIGFGGNISAPGTTYVGTIQFADGSVKRTAATNTLTASGAIAYGGSYTGPSFGWVQGTEFNLWVPSKLPSVPVMSLGYCAVNKPGIQAYDGAGQMALYASGSAPPFKLYLGEWNGTPLVEVDANWGVFSVLGDFASSNGTFAGNVSAAGFQLNGTNIGFVTNIVMTGGGSAIISNHTAYVTLQTPISGSDVTNMARAVAVAILMTNHLNGAQYEQVVSISSNIAIGTMSALSPANLSPYPPTLTGSITNGAQVTMFPGRWFPPFAWDEVVTIRWMTNGVVDQSGTNQTYTISGSAGNGTTLQATLLLTNYFGSGFATTPVFTITNASAGGGGLGVTFGVGNNHAITSPSSALTLGSTWTIQGYVKASGSQANGTILFLCDGPSEGSIGDYIWFAINGSSCNVGIANGWATGTATVTDSAWHHFMLSCDGTTVYLFLDGVLDNSWTANSTLSGNTTVLIGNQWIDVTNPLSGSLRRLKISSICEQTSSFTPPSSPTSIVSDGNTMALWALEDGTGTTASDSGPNNLPATLVGDPLPSWITP